MPALNSLYGTESAIRMPQTMSGTYRKWIAMAIGNRMKLMPFIRTLTHNARQTGVPVVRPLFFDLAESDPNVYQIHDQFMLGDAILVSPVLDPNVNEFKAYFPHGSWYGLWTGDLVGGGGGYKNIQDIEYQVAAHVRGGKIIPLKVHCNQINVYRTYQITYTFQKTYSHSNIDTYRTQDNTLMVALGCDVDPRGVTSTCEASGDLFLEVPGLNKDEVVVTFTAKSYAMDGSLQGGKLSVELRRNFIQAKVFGASNQ